ncbi:AmmeMemoRadiSam system protein A [Geoalkalibacter halelectricus]|uniref:AmmeMemoRadiSam system protein A n=1 Tax=Geoalkalibacter halelectricus TaxID=2847045 RepID=A0ABY5ZHE3_9BACT|nr:AmmeMemoRadiSam system protein A [Geoalkalibacter halelectricus]MDO3379612.1 AmmeMemoRadiSam system protein A [Geoalkalibacter halelectricus]UWZ78572.1 AmmeMemoRadiSam system protein A [Geoalkalibacter halelectricus]
MDKELTDKDKKILLKAARKAICDFVSKESFEPEPREEKSLNRRSGCFVTIKQDGQLRGCIGNFQSERPLFKEVAEMAVASATKDPRFYPMKAADLENFSLEISVLSPLKKIENIEEIEIGTHGIYLEKGFYRGVLLPQVATEHHWDRITFLKQTCIKAGLPTNAWQSEDAEIYIFSAQIFGEK